MERRAHEQGRQTEATKRINGVLTSIPTYYLTVFQLRKWAVKRIDKIRRSFLWKGTPEANGGHCLVRGTRQ